MARAFWALKYFSDAGHSLAWLHAEVPKHNEPGTVIRNFMGRRRIRQVAKLANAHTIATGGSIEKMQARLLESGESVMAMPDAPLLPGRSSLPVTLLGRPARLPAGVISLAAELHIPILVYTIRATETGHRDMQIFPAIRSDDAQHIAQQLADHVSNAILQDSAAWHVWSVAETFFCEQSVTGRLLRPGSKGASGIAITDSPLSNSRACIFSILPPVAIVWALANLAT